MKEGLFIHFIVGAYTPLQLVNELLRRYSLCFRWSILGQMLRDRFEFWEELLHLLELFRDKVKRMQSLFRQMSEGREPAFNLLQLLLGGSFWFLLALLLIFLSFLLVWRLYAFLAVAARALATPCAGTAISTRSSLLPTAWSNRFLFPWGRPSAHFPAAAAAITVEIFFFNLNIHAHIVASNFTHHILIHGCQPARGMLLWRHLVQLDYCKTVVLRRLRGGHFALNLC